MRRLNKTEIKSLTGLSIAGKEDLLPTHIVQRVKKMPSHTRALKIINMDCMERDEKFGVKGGEQAYDRAWKIWHKLYESAIKRTPKLFIEKANSDKVARTKFTNEDVELFRTYLYDAEIDNSIDEGYGEVGGEETAAHWLKARKKTILDEMFWLYNDANELANFLEDLKSR